MQDKKKLRYVNGIDDDESSRIDSSPSSFPSSKKSIKKLHILIAGGIIAISLIANIVLGYKCLSVAKAVNSAIATNKESEDKANEAINASITATQSQLEKYQQSADALTRNQNAMLGELSRELQFFKKTGSFVEPAPNKDCPDKDFLTLGIKYDTDKVVKAHVYNRLYEPYFHPVRCNPIKILEIGLGCDMFYGPGHSYNLWLEYFPFADIYFIEYDKKCADIWAKKDPRVKVYQGDQSDRTFLRQFLTETGGAFDFIIDDGGHSMTQQITSLEELVPGLKPGGTYFLEDLLSSFWGGRKDNDPTATLTYIKDMMSDLMARRANLQPNLKPLTDEITRIDCIDEMCAFTRKV